MEESADLNLGNSIKLTGFKEVDKSSMFVVRKILGNYVKKMEGFCDQFESLGMTLKPVHQTSEKTEKFEIHGKLLDNGKIYSAENTDRNLFFAMDKVLSKIESEVKK